MIQTTRTGSSCCQPCHHALPVLLVCPTLLSLPTAPAPFPHSSPCSTHIHNPHTHPLSLCHQHNTINPAHPCTLHGVATWFDVLFNGTTSQRWLSTAPGLPATHWFQLRCVLQQPLVLLTPNSRVSGCLHLVAHERQSYDIHLELEAPPVSPGMPVQKVRGSEDLVGLRR